jgi:NTE family protein
MERFLKILFGRARTFDTRRPFLPVAVDLTGGNDVIVQGCEIWEAIYGSQTIPGMIPLINYNGMYLADGALANNVPASQARHYGAETVIAVNISPTPDATTFDPRKVASNMLRSVEVMMHQTTQRSHEFCDLEIRPEVFEYGLMDFKHAERFMELGREAARAHLPELRLLLAERKWHMSV